MKPILLERNCPPQFYRGGHRILAFRGEPESTEDELREPEDWLASTTHLFADDSAGATTLPDGRLLSEAVEADPADWFGSKHLLLYGTDPGLLVKLLDTDERLPVHLHPDRAFAARHLGCPHGKTEAWLVLDAEPDATVWLGFKERVDSHRLHDLVDIQAEQILGLLNEFPVSRGDAIVVPAGQPHAIGAGVFVVELQEPTDFSVMLEHERFGLDSGQGFLGLDAEIALRSVTRTPLHLDELGALRTRWDESTNDTPAGIRTALAAAADPYFRAEVIGTSDAPAELPAGYSVLVVVDGKGRLATTEGGSLDLSSGQVVVTPYASGELRLDGDLTVVRCQPPDAAQDIKHP